MIREEFEKEFGKIPYVKIIGKSVNSAEISIIKILVKFIILQIKKMFFMKN